MDDSLLSQAYRRLAQSEKKVDDLNLQIGKLLGKIEYLEKETVAKAKIQDKLIKLLEKSKQLNDRQKETVFIQGKIKAFKELLED